MPPPRAATVPYTLRPAVEADRAFCYTLVAVTTRADHDASHGELPDSEHVARFDAAWPIDLLPFTRIVEVAGERIGQLVIYTEPARVFVKDLELMPAWQNRGIGASLLRGVLDAAAGRPVELKVMRTNTRAQRFYERVNFRIVQTAPGYHLMRFEPDPAGHIDD